MTAMAATAYFTVSNAVRQDQTSATVINIAGRQRMLSQRIAFFLNKARIEGADSILLGNARDAIDLFERSHTALIVGNPDMGLPPLSAPGSRDIYFGEPALDAEARNYILIARTMLQHLEAAQAAPEDLAQRLNDEAAGPLLSLLNQAVAEFERQSLEAVQRLQMILKVLISVALLLLLALVVFIFRPAVRNVLDSMKAANEAETKSERAAEDRKLVLNAVGHELKTPLNQLTHAAAVLRETDLEAQQQDLLADIDAANADISESVKSVLNYVSVDSAGTTIAETPVDVAALVAQVVAKEEAAAANKNLPLFAMNMATEALPLPRLFLDRDQIELILSKLVNNAVRFTDKGRVLIDYEFRPYRDDAGELEIRVHDTGPGIAPAQRKHLFSPFYGAARSGAATRGLGLGLAYAQRAAKHLGGEISVSSSLGDGSVFSLKLPVHVADTPAEPATPAPRPSDQPSCLVAEDNPVNQIVLTKLLKESGYKVTMVNNGRDAVDAALAEHFDAILLDILMPEMRGDEACSLIREELSPNCPRLIAVTANDLSDDVVRYKQAGFDAIVSKPIVAQQLRLALAATTPSDASA